MLVEFNQLDTKKELSKKYLKLLDTNQALIFSRLDQYKECIAIVPYSKFKDRRKICVWLSGEEGSYSDGLPKERTEIAKILTDGQWIHQPKAFITLDQYKG